MDRNYSEKMSSLNYMEKNNVEHQEWRDKISRFQNSDISL